MREAVREEIEAAADELDRGLNQALDLRPDHSDEMPAAYNLTAAKITELAQAYLPLKIAGVADKQGYLQVHEARMEIKGLRVAVDKKRKELNADSQEYIRAVNGYAKQLTAMLAPIEAHLEAEEKAVDAEIEKAKAEAQRIADERNQGRLDALIAVGAQISLAQVVLMDDPTFESYLALATKAHKEAQAKAAQEAAEAEAKAQAEAAEKARKEKEEADRLAKIKAEQAAEAERLEAIRVEQAKQAAELKAKQDELNAKAKAIADAEKAEQDRKNLEAKIKAESERVQREAQEKAERETLAAKARAEAEAVRLAAIEAAKPDAEKLFNLAMEMDVAAWPEMATEAGRVALEGIKTLNTKMANYTRERAQALMK